MNFIKNVTKRWLICNIAVLFMLTTSNLEHNNIKGADFNSCIEVVLSVRPMP